MCNGIITSAIMCFLNASYSCSINIALLLSFELSFLFPGKYIVEVKLVEEIKIKTYLFVCLS